MQTKYGYSQRHDAALDACITSGKPCPFGCVKNGAPNCYAHVVGHYGIEQCDFGGLTAHLAIAGFGVVGYTQAHLIQRAVDGGWWCECGWPNHYDEPECTRPSCGRPRR